VVAIAQSESVRRGGVALALSPLAMLLSGALKDQRSDHLAFAMQAVNNPWVLLADRLVYWPDWDPDPSGDRLQPIRFRYLLEPAP